MDDSTARRMTRRRVLAALAAVAGFGGFAAPFLLAADLDDRPVWLVEAIPGLAAAGAGPFSTEALLAAIAVGVFATVLAVTVVLAVALAVRPASRRLPRILSVIAIVLLAGCAGAGLLVLMLSANADGRALPVSPAVLLATVGAVLAIVAARSGRATS